MPRRTKAELEAELREAMMEKALGKPISKMTSKELALALGTLGGSSPAPAPKAPKAPKAKAVDSDSVPKDTEAKPKKPATKRTVIEKQTTVALPNGDTIVKIVRPFQPAAKDLPPPPAPADTDKPKKPRIVRKKAAPEPAEFEEESE